MRAERSFAGGHCSSCPHCHARATPGRLYQAKVDSSRYSCNSCWLLCRVTAIVIVRSTGALGRHHRRSQRMLGSATYSKCGTMCRLFQALQNLCTDTLLRFGDLPSLKPEDDFRVMLGEFGTEAQPTLRYLSDATPLLIADFKDLLHHVLGMEVPLLGN